jgi:glutathione S-transferase
MSVGDHLSSKMKLYGLPSDPNTLKCLMAAGEKGVDIESIAVSDTSKQEISNISPFGTTPALRDADFTLCGTRAIMSYLDDKGFGPSLVPRNGVVRALQYQCIHIATETVGPAVANLLAGEDVDQAVATLGAAFDVLNTTLKNKKQRGDFLVGDFTLADLHWAPYAHACIISGHGDLVTTRDAVNAWWEKVKAHKSTSKENYVASTILPTMDEIKNNQLKSITINA